MKAGRVRIRGAWWRIVIKVLAPSKVDGKWLPTHGLCHYESRTIYLNPQFDMAAALRHEVTHACQPDLDEQTVQEIEEAHLNADAVLRRIK